jgi:hypothetical protein
MRSIVRCPQCFTYVYSDATTCHGCGHKIGRRRWLTRGSWVFITLAVAGYGIARGIDLHQEKRDREIRQHEQETEMAAARSFLQSWLTSPSEELSRKFHDRKVFGPQLVALRDRFPDVLPATVVDFIRLEPRTWQQHHSQKDSGPVKHTSRDKDPKLRVSRAIRSDDTGDYSWRTRSWFTYEYRFEAEVHRDDRWYSVTGRLCIDGSTVHCLVIERVDSLEGEVKPEE